MSHAPPPPAPDRRSALLHLLDAADGITSDFFKPSTAPGADDFRRQFADVELRVRKRTASSADPANVVYEIYLGRLLPSTTKPLLAYVLHPKGDAEANRDAFKRCLQELADKKAYFMSEKKA